MGPGPGVRLSLIANLHRPLFSKRIPLWWSDEMRRRRRGRAGGKVDGASRGEGVNPSDLSRINLSASRQIGICRRRRHHRARCKTQLHGPTDLLWSTGGRRRRRRAEEDLLSDVTAAVVAVAAVVVALVWRVCALTRGRGAAP